MDIVYKIQSQSKVFLTQIYSIEVAFDMKMSVHNPPPPHQASWPLKLNIMDNIKVKIEEKPTKKTIFCSVSQPSYCVV